MNIRLRYMLAPLVLLGTMLAAIGIPKLRHLVSYESNSPCSFESRPDLIWETQDEYINRLKVQFKVHRIAEAPTDSKRKEAPDSELRQFNSRFVSSDVVNSARILFLETYRTKMEAAAAAGVWVFTDTIHLECKVGEGLYESRKTHPYVSSSMFSYLYNPESQNWIELQAKAVPTAH